MLGEFSLQWEETSIFDTQNRSRKPWSLLAYLICNRDKTISQQKLTELMWEDEPDTVNPENALRIMMHRLRTQLDKLYPGAGRDLILTRDGSYCWNDSVEMKLDCEEFSRLYHKRCDSAQERSETLQQALSLYKGGFLPRHSGQMWVGAAGVHYQNLFLQASMELAQYYLETPDTALKAVEVCRRGVKLEPYHEPLHQYLMRGLAAMGDAKGAAAVYETLSRRLFDEFGIWPDDKTREIYRAVAFPSADHTLPTEEVFDGLTEPEGNMGAMECDFDHFKVLCYAEGRAIERSGTVTHIALFHLAGETDAPLSKRTGELFMPRFQDVLCSNLRRGDTISKCSVSQYIVMLPKANYENSCLVCQRILNVFHKTYPRAKLRINYVVRPLNPGISVL